MIEQTLKAMLDRPKEHWPDIYVKRVSDEKYTIIIDGKTLMTQRKKVRLFRLQAAAEFLDKMELTEFRTEL